MAYPTITYVDLSYEIMHCIGFFIPTISGYATDINYLDIFQFHALTVTVTNA